MDVPLLLLLLRAPTRRNRNRPALTPILTRLRSPLAPLHPLPAGAPHPAFPATLLAYHLLTEVQLDSIARYYHQWTTSPCPWTLGYPAAMDWDGDFLAHIGRERGMLARVSAKRRKVGRFIGLRGCETPVEEVEERERFWVARDRAQLKTAGV